jgi:predicted CoA-binding protein
MKVLVLGASPKSDRYSYKAVELLRKHGHEVIAVGLNPGMIGETSIQREIPEDIPFDTVTIYLSAPNQKDYYYIIPRLKPRRVIFNPGAENPEWEQDLHQRGIETKRACTLVLLNTGQF